MSNGTLQQISSKGVQDGHLSISPQTSFFKRTYKRVSNFAIESIDVSIPSIAWGKDVVVQIPRNGDLLTEMWLVLEINLLRPPGVYGVDPPMPVDTLHWTNVLGHAMLKNSQLEIGNNQIDKIDGTYLEINHELQSDINVNVDELVLRSKSAQQLQTWSFYGNTLSMDGNPVVQIYCQLKYWFGSARSQALPIISLQYHDVRQKFTLRAKSELISKVGGLVPAQDTTYNGDISAGYLMANFCYLDSLERRLFASNSHEYLLRNNQLSDFHLKASSASKVAAQVIFNHPVTAFYFFVQRSDYVQNNEYFNWQRSDGQGDDTILSATVKFNGSEREKPRGALFWRTINSSTYFSKTPERPLYCYSFAQYPGSWFPSGSCNLSRIDTTTLEFTFPTTTKTGAVFPEANVVIYADNFNVIRIQGGMAAKKYAN